MDEFNKCMSSLLPSYPLTLPRFIPFPPYFFMASFYISLASALAIIECNASLHRLIPHNPLADARLCSPRESWTKFPPGFFSFSSQDVWTQGSHTRGAIPCLRMSLPAAEKNCPVAPIYFVMPLFP
jgi:hypothetical protein